MNSIPVFAGFLLILGAAVSSHAEESATAPSAETATHAIDASPRHGEYVDVAVPGSDVKLKTWVVYPERADKAPVVSVIHEIFWLSDWIRAVADALAAQGFIAIAPDLISGIEGAEANPREAIGKLSDEEAIKRLNAAMAYGIALPSAKGKAATVGFCWGGRTSFLFASAQPKLSAAIVYYGTSPSKEALATIEAPVLGLYGQMDERVNATIPDAEAEMKRLGKSFEKHIYENAGHGFLRQQDGRDGANRKASEEAWKTTLEFLKNHTS